METKKSPSFMRPLLDSYINGNRNDHRTDYGLLSQEEKMTYLLYCNDELSKYDFQKLLKSIRSY